MASIGFTDAEIRALRGEDAAEAVRSGKGWGVWGLQEHVDWAEAAVW
jgi:hypothetical protein